MNDYDNTNSGMLSKSDDRKTDKSPEYRGFINVEGTEYWLSGWVKEGKSGGKMAGKKFFSLSIQAKDGQTAKAKEAPAMADLDEDIPF